MLTAALRYATNRAAMVAREEGYRAAAVSVARLSVAEAAKLPRAALVAWRRWRRPASVEGHPPLYSDAIVRDVEGLGRGLEPYTVDVNAFRAHVAAFEYPRHYAGGSLEKGGGREEKLLEYFVSLDLLALRPTDVVIDVASEWSVFPAVARAASGATVYRQDLIYPRGVQGRRIGGNAAQMPVPDAFCDKIVLHNAFEHFEGSADTEFIREAGRVMGPGGVLCIVPLPLMERYTIISDPVVSRRGIGWDEGARVVELPWWHNRFGRHYDAQALERRVLSPASRVGLVPTIYHVVNPHEVHPGAYLHFALTMRKAEPT